MSEIPDNLSSEHAAAREYLFGRLSSPKLDEIEDRLAHEPAFGDFLNEVEDDLVDDFVRDALDSTERDEFVNFFAVNKRRREKIKFAAVLHKVATTKKSRAAVSASWFADRFRFKPRLAFAFVVTITVLAIVPALYNLPPSRGTSLGDSAQTKPLEITLPVHETFPVVVSEPAQIPEKKPEVVAKTEAPRVSRVPRVQPSPATTAAMKTTLALMLKPITRDETSANTIRLTPSTQTVTLSVAISEGDEFTQYELTTTSVTGEPIARRIVKPNTGRAATIVIPSEKLRPGAYDVALRGIDRDGKPEDLNFYRLEVK